jgi:hypothetical protein
MSMFVFPLIYVASRMIAGHLMTRVVATHLVAGRNRAEQMITDALVSTLTQLGLNVAVFFIAVYGLQGRTAPGVVVLVVTSVYAASVLHFLTRLVLQFRLVAELATHLLMHGWHAPRAWIRTQVTREIDARLAKMGWLTRLVHRLGPGPKREVLIELTTHEVWRLVSVRLLLLVSMVTAYVFIFNVWTRPLLLREATGLGWLQAFLWPFAHSVDYFFGTQTSNWIRRMPF